MLKKLNSLLLALLLSVVSLFAQSPDYAKMDKHALAAPSNLKGNPAELAKYLVSKADNDFEKIRGLFRWVTNNIDYDVEGYLSGGDIYKSPEEAMKSGKAVCDGYAGVVALLSKHAGLEVVKISGYSKGYGYNVGDGPGRSNHAWNAVRISGKWYLFDATWGAGAVDNSGKYQRNFQEFYFLTPPEKFIYDHFPDDPEWQLLTPQISAVEFSNLPYLRPQYFITGIETESGIKNVSKSAGKTRLELTAPENVLITTTLFSPDGSDISTFTFLQREGKNILLDMVFPEKGNYKLRLYSKFASEEGSYSWAADYGFEVDEPIQGFDGFPVRYEKFNLTSSLLVSPVMGRLDSGKKYNFEIVIPGAVKVAVIIDGNFTMLNPLPNKKSRFTGEVTITGKEIMLAANFGDGNRFEGLLGYQIK